MKKAYNIWPKNLLIGLFILLGAAQKAQATNFLPALPLSTGLVTGKLGLSCYKKQWGKVLGTCLRAGTGYYVGRQLPGFQLLGSLYAGSLFKSLYNNSNNLEIPASDHVDFITGLLWGQATLEDANSLSEEEPKEKAKAFTFDDLAGTIPQEVQEIVEFIKNKEKYVKLGARMPRGILLTGPPGTGKTSIARAIAGETNALFIAATGTSFVECITGLGAARVRQLFDRARNGVRRGTYEKAIIFIDEIDGFGEARSSSNLDSERRATINELLNQLDGFNKNDSVFVIAATNRVEDLDPALIRPGRFDRIVPIELPNKDNREAILRLYIQRIQSSDLNIKALAEQTSGLNCATLESLVNEAAIHAVRRNTELVTQEDFENALQVMAQKDETVAATTKRGEKPFTFDNLAGTIPHEVHEIVEFIKNKEKYDKVGARMPRGILLVGPPGTGKTSIARAIAGEAQASFFATSGTQFVSKWVGEGAERIRELFQKARTAPYEKAIVFIDEIDSIGRRRSGADNAGGYTSCYLPTLNELLNQLDGFKQDDSVFVIAATNRVQDLDPALIRSGRFDRIVTIGLPNTENREAILKLHIQRIQSADLNIKLIAEKTEGLNCADLENLVNKAAIHSVHRNAEVVTQEDFDEVLNEKAT